MARRITKKCVACAQLSAADAQQLHGKKGDGCWDEKRCPRRRSHYRHRQRLNEKGGCSINSSFWCWFLMMAR